MAAFPETLQSEHLFDIHFNLEPAQPLGQTPLGGRTIFGIKDGAFEGPRLRGTVLPGGGDWYLARTDGVGELDVRATLRTHDGALVYMTYRGVLDAKPEVIARIFAGEDVDPAAYYFRTTPRFETPADEYAWLNTLVCIGVGHPAPNKASYRVFAIR